MKRTILSITLLLSFEFSYNQSIYSLVFSYTEDANIGLGCLIDYNNSKKEISAISNALGYNLVEKHFTSDFNKRNLDNVISSINIGPKDLIFLYISSHGARSIQGDNNEFPQIVVPNGNSTVMVSSYNYIYSQVKKLKAKFTIAIIDACNGYANISPKEIRIYPKTYNPKVLNTLTSLQKNNYARLFQNYNGSLLITSSQPGKNSLSTPYGSVFTNCFFQSLHYYIDMKDENNFVYINWANLLDRAKEYTLNETLRLSVQNADFESYFPVWENNLSFVSSSTTISTNNTVREAPTSLRLYHVFKSIKKEEMDELGTKHTDRLSCWIEGSRDELQKVDHVIYYLDHSFEDPVHSSNDTKHGFRATYLTSNMNKLFFYLRAKIVFKDGREIERSEYPGEDDNCEDGFELCSCALKGYLPCISCYESGKCNYDYYKEKGSGKCASCRGSGDRTGYNPDGSTFVNGSCKSCQGTGKCKHCSGTGACDMCEGKGKYVCTNCKGTGKVPCSK